MSSEDEIALLTAEINAFAFSHEWLPLDESEPVWSAWKRVRKPSTISAPKRSTLLRPIWEQCATILNGILQNRNAYLFSRPVDPDRDGVINYFEVIKHPMDLGTVKQRLALQTRRRNEPLKPSMYRCPMEMLTDVNRVWENCFQYNPPGFEVRKMGEILKSEFDRRWKAMRIEESVQRINKQCGSEEEVKSTVLPDQGLKEDTTCHITKAPKKRKTGFVERERKPNQSSNLKDPKPRPKKEVVVKEGVLNSPKKAPIEHPSSTHPDLQTKKKNKSSIPHTSKLDRLGGGGGTGNGGGIKNKTIREKNISNRKDGDKKGIQSRNSHRRVEENKMRRLIQSCQQPTTRKPVLQPEVKETPKQRAWLPPIERGGGLQTTSKDKTNQPSKIQPSTIKPSSKETTLKQSLALNEELKKSLKHLNTKSESEMSDFEVRRKLSQLLESVTLNAIQILTQTVLSKDPSFTSGESNLDLLEIKYVRHAVRSLLGAAAKKNKEKATLAAQAKQASSMKENPSPMSAQTSKKKRKVEEEGTPLATKTPRVSSPSPPWDRGLTHNRTVWENAVGSCGITPCLNGKELDLTLRPESDGSNWEEAVPDDVEEGEIRN